MVFFQSIIKQWKHRLHGRAGQATWCYLFPSLLSLLTLALLGGTAWTITWPTDNLGWSPSEGRILDVAPGQPGEQVSVQPGDRIVAVDNRPLAEVIRYAGYRPGQQVVLTIQRGTEIQDITLVLASPSPDTLLWGLIPIVVALIFWGAGLVVFALHPTWSISRTFFSLTQATALVLATGQLSTVNVPWTTQLFYLTLTLLPLLLVRFYGAVSENPLFLHRRGWLLPALISASLALPYLPWPALHLEQTGWHPFLRLAIRAYLGLTLLVIILSLIYTCRTTPSAKIRRRLRGLIFGAAIGLAPLIFLSLLPEMLWGTGTGLPYQMTFSCLAFIPLSHVYVIVKHDLHPLDRLINRSLVAFLLGLLWATAYLAGVGLGLALFHETPLLYPLVGALVTMGLVAWFTPLREKIQHLVDQFFYGGWYDYRQAISYLSHALCNTTSRQELADRLVQGVVDALRLQGAAFYLRGLDGNLVLEKSITLVMPNRLSTQELLDLKDMTDLTRHLLLVQDENLLGALLLGKKDDDFYEPTDEEILHTLTEQASLAAAQVLLIDDLQQTLTALENIQQQMLTNREEERRILAWELHDGPIQDLIALGHQICACRDQFRQSDPALAGTLEEIRQETIRIMDLLRDTCAALRSDVLDTIGVGPAMIQYACDQMQETGITIYLDVPRYGPKLADPLGITLLRVFQESIKNAIEHANVAEIWTRFELCAGQYELRIWDKGRGFVVPPRLDLLVLQRRFGLATMKERAESVHAHLTVQSSPGQGTQVRMWGQIEPLRQDHVHPNHNIGKPVRPIAGICDCVIRATMN